MKALSVKKCNRFQTMEELKNELLCSQNVYLRLGKRCLWEFFFADGKLQIHISDT